MVKKATSRKQVDVLTKYRNLFFLSALVITFLSLATALSYRVQYLDSRESTFYPNIYWELGDIVEGKGFIYSVADVRTDTQDIPSYWELAEGNVFLLVRVALKNTSDSTLEFSPVSTMQVRSEDGVYYEVSSAPGIKDSLGGPVLPGETVYGEVGFTVPGTMKKGNLVYVPSQPDQHTITTNISVP